MKKKLSELFRFMHSFGFASGAVLYLKMKSGKLNNIRIPGVLHPLTLRKNSSDYDTFYQAIVHNQYKFKYGVQPAVIIDGGANIGLATIAFKNMYPEAKIISVEPDSENFAQLQENIKAYSDVFLLKAGLWNTTAILKVTDKFNVGKWGMVTEEVNEAEEGTIPTITITEIMEKFSLTHIDILKLDIETAEKELFSSNYEGWLPKVKVIVIELHDFISSGTAKPFFEAINKTFSSYRFFQLGENTIIINEDLVQNKEKAA